MPTNEIFQNLPEFCHITEFMFMNFLMVYVRLSQNQYVHPKGTEKFWISEHFRIFAIFQNFKNKLCAFWMHILILKQPNLYHQKVRKH